MSSVPEPATISRVCGAGFRLRQSGLPGRVAFLAVLFSVELIILSVSIDAASLRSHAAIAVFVSHWGHDILSAIVAFAALLVIFGRTVAQSAVRQTSERLARTPISPIALAGHFGAMAVLAAVSHLLFGHFPTHWRPDPFVGAWAGIGLLAIGLAGVAFVPLTVAYEFVRQTWVMWVLSGLGGIAACAASDAAHFLWQPLTAVTFRLVAVLLRPFISDLIVDPATMGIGTQRFYVLVLEQCSGIEGAALMLIFTSLAIWLFRRECRFPHALLIVPAGVSLIWLLNAVRIAALVLIGNAGAPGIAMGGFHSQAGWIAFNAAALGCAFALRRIPWFAAPPTPRRKEHAAVENPTAWYLMPFLTILASAMVTRALASDGFEWLYPLRFFAAAGALFYYRRTYARLEWRIGWAAPFAGAIAYLIWAGWDFLMGRAQGAMTFPAAMSLFTPLKLTWLALRTAAAVLTVPLAEELAFRGFLLRRLNSRDFESVSPAKFTLVSIAISSIAFGALNDGHYVPGAISGLLYAWAYRSRGSIGDAVGAHAITNALLAVSVGQ